MPSEGSTPDKSMRSVKTDSSHVVLRGCKCRVQVLSQNQTTKKKKNKEKEAKPTGPLADPREQNRGNEQLYVDLYTVLPNVHPRGQTSRLAAGFCLCPRCASNWASGSTALRAHGKPGPGQRQTAKVDSLWAAKPAVVGQ